MEERVVLAAELVLEAHAESDCPKTAAAGVALARMVLDRHDREPTRFSFDLEEPEEKGHGGDLAAEAEALDKAGPTVKP